MKILLCFFGWMGFLFSAWAQNYSESFDLSSDGMLQADLGNVALNLKVSSQNASFLKLTYKELVLFKKQKYTGGKNYQFDTLDLSASKKQVTITFEAKELKMGCVILSNVPVKVQYTIPYNPKDIPYLPLQLLQTAGVPSLQNNELVISNIPSANYDGACISPTTTPTTTTTTTTTNNNSSNTNSSTTNSGTYTELANANEIRLIPCSSNPSVIQLKSSIQNNLLTNFSMSVTEETNIPPPAKVVDNFQFGVTIRYFHDDDEPKAQELKQVLSSLGKAVHLENMLPRYLPDGIPDYLEVWIK